MNNNEYIKKRVKKCKEEKICPQCGKNKNHSLNILKCKECHEKSLTCNKNNRENKIKNKICIDCKKNTNSNKQRCYLCTEKLAKSDKEKRKEYRIKRICLKCKTNSLDIEKSPYCEQCRNRAKEILANKVLERESKNICVKCGKMPMINQNRYCELCILKGISWNCLKNGKRYNEILNILKKQNYTCPYTGIKLIIGTNASVDHILPRCQGGSNEIDNLQWVHIWVNYMKGSLKELEFKNIFADFITKSYNNVKEINIDQSILDKNIGLAFNFNDNLKSFAELTK